MSLLARLAQFLSKQKPVAPEGDPAALSVRRLGAYRELFGAEPLRVLSHDLFNKPPFGGRVDVVIYQLPYERRHGEVQVAVTNGMSDYPMRLPGRKGGQGKRRELIQYFRQCRVSDVARLHDLAWLPLAQRFCLDFFETAGPYPDSTWPNSLFVPPLVVPHAQFRLQLEGEAEPMQFLWHVPLSQAEFEFKAASGLDALLARMEERNLPWVFDADERPSLV